jgi:hypothetical protein
MAAVVLWAINSSCKPHVPVSREKQRECRCCVAAAAFVAPAGVGHQASLLSCSKSVPSCIIINNSQDTGVRCRGVRRRNFLVYCLCYCDRSLILGSNNWYLEPRLGRGEPAEDVNVGTTYGRGERVVGGMVEIPKPRRGIRSCWWWLARGGNQRRWCDEAPGRVLVCGCAGHVVALVRQSRSIGVCRRPEKRRVSPRRRLWRSRGDGACRGGRIRSEGRGGGRGDDDGSCRNSGNAKSRLGGGVVWRRHR